MLLWLRGVINHLMNYCSFISLVIIVFGLVINVDVLLLICNSIHDFEFFNLFGDKLVSNINANYSVESSNVLTIDTTALDSSIQDKTAVKPAEKSLWQRDPELFVLNALNGFLVVVIGGFVLYGYFKGYL